MLVLSLVLAGLFAGPAHAEEKLSVTGPEKTVEVELDKNEQGNMVGSARFVVGTSKELPQGVTAAAYLDATGDSDTLCTNSKAGAVTLRDAPAKLTVASPAVVIVDFTVDRKCAARQGTLVVAAAKGKAEAAPAVAPATVRFTFIRGVEHDPEYGYALVAATVLALITLILMIVASHVVLGAEVKRGWLSVPLPIEVPWSAKESWVTNITALGALLGTALGVAGVLEEWLPGISLSRFLTTNLLFGGLVVLAPVVYAASCTYAIRPDSEGNQKLKPTGHGWGLVASAAVTVFGVYGQLAMILTMTVASNADRPAKWGLGIALGLAAVAVMLYAVLFVRGILAAALVADAQNKKAAEEEKRAKGKNQPETTTPRVSLSISTAAAL